MRWIAGLVLGLLAGQQAAAQRVAIAEITPGYTYFNREGATIDVHDAAIAECLADLAALTTFREDIGYAGGIVGGLLNASPRRNILRSGIENCMIVGGWRLVRVEESEGAALAALPQARLRERLAAMVGAANPAGTVVRRYANEASDAANDRFSASPDFDGKGSLSFRALDPQRINPPAPRVDATPLRAKRVNPKQMASMPASTSFIVFAFKGVSTRNGIGLYFRREGPDRFTGAAAADSQPDFIGLQKGALFASKTGNFAIFAVPPGRWRLDSIELASVTSFCLGSPAFDVGAGEIVYTGMFDFGAADLTPDPALDPARALIGDAALAARVRPARFVNGSRGPCIGNSVYAVEFGATPPSP